MTFQALQHVYVVSVKPIKHRLGKGLNVHSYFFKNYAFFPSFEQIGILLNKYCFLFEFTGISFKINLHLKTNITFILSYDPTSQ